MTIQITREGVKIEESIVKEVKWYKDGKEIDAGEVPNLFSFSTILSIGQSFILSFSITIGDNTLTGEMPIRRIVENSNTVLRLIAQQGNSILGENNSILVDYDENGDIDFELTKPINLSFSLENNGENITN